MPAMVRLVIDASDPDLSRLLRRVTGGESSPLAEAIDGLRDAHHRLVQAEQRVDRELVERFGVDRGSTELARLRHQLKVRIGAEEPPKRRLHHLFDLLSKATLGHVDLLTRSATPRGRCRDCRGTSRTGTISARRVLLSATVAAAVALLVRYVAVHIHDGEAEFD